MSQQEITVLRRRKSHYPLIITRKRSLQSQNLERLVLEKVMAETFKGTKGS